MDLTITPASVILDMLEATVTLIMMTAARFLAFMVSAEEYVYFYFIFFPANCNIYNIRNGCRK